MKRVSYIDSNLFSPKDAWDALTMAEKSEMMKVAVQNGITNLEDIRREYNEFAGGGYMDKAKALIKKNEGWMAKPYKDAPEGKSWRSVGYGFNDSGFYDKYPEGISRHYENGITKAQAEQELNYVLNKADKHLRNIYGKQWDSFNDNQKAAIMDTYYQRPASVGKKSAFYNAVKSGKDASKYLGVKGFADRNKKRQSVFGGGAVPMVADNIDTSLTQEVALQPIVENIPEFIPLNPQTFNTTLPTYQRPELTFEEPVVQETLVSPYSPEEIERQERAEGLANLGRFLSFTNTSGSNNTFLNTIGMLTGNTFAEGGDTNDNDLVDWIIREEGFNSKPENIGDGKITLGSGLTDKKWHDLYRKRGNKWSAEDNRMAVAEEVANRRKWAEKNIPNWDTLPDSAQKALLSYKYNYNFTSANSPKLFQALADSNLYEAAKQMDATSKDPKFKKGLMDRRKREQEWFLSDVAGNAASTQAIPVQTPTTIGISMPSITEPAVSTAVRNNYVPATTTPYNRGNNMRRAFESAVAFNRMMDATSLQNNPLPEYQFPIEYAEGGKIHIKPSHRGRLTELKKRTGKSEAELYKTGGPAVRKMITFARNARKWKHGLGGNLFDGATEDSQQMMNPYRPNGGFYYINSEGQPVNPTTRDIIELPDVVVAADKNSPSWYNRTTVGGFDENGFHESWEGIQPLVMSSSEWNRSHSANDLQTMDPYGEIPWNAAAVATGFLAPELASSYIAKGAQLPFEAADRGKRFILDVGDRYQGMKDASAYKNANGNMDARTIANMKWWENGGTPTGINKTGISNSGDLGIYYLHGSDTRHYFSPTVEKGGEMTLTTHLGGGVPGGTPQEVLPMNKSEKTALAKYLTGIPEYTYLGEAGRTKNYAEQYFNVKPSRIKAFKDAIINKKEINKPYWNEEEHITEFLKEENPANKEFYKHLYEANEPLSADSYKFILQEAAKDKGRFALRYDSSPMGTFNPQGIYEKDFYNSLLPLAPQEQVNTINKWMKSYYPKARPAYLEDGKVIIPRPFLMVRSKK